MSLVSICTPLRISFLGGGSDFPNYLIENEGCVLGATFDWNIYTHILPIPEIAREKYRLTYRITESVESVEDLQHPVVRECLRILQWRRPINVSTMSDVPGGTGLGSSSSFTVGLIQGLTSISGDEIDRSSLAELAIKIERQILQEPGGLQDQYHAAFGGFRSYKFNSTKVIPSDLLLNEVECAKLSKNLLLVSISEPRSNSLLAAKTTKLLDSRTGIMLANRLAQIARTATETISKKKTADHAFETLSYAINESWAIKSKMVGENPTSRKHFEVNKIAKKYGITTTKILGSGDSGFALYMGKPDSISDFKKNLREMKEFVHSPTLGNTGTRLTSL